jgi:hypothetical protein
MSLDVDVLERPRDATVEAKLVYLEPSQGKPEVDFTASVLGEGSAIYAPRRVTIRDARAIDPSLDVEGFALLRHRTKVRDLGDDAQAENAGRAEAAAIVARATGAAIVHVFDHTIRRHAPEAARQPSTRVHNDYTPFSARRRVRELLGEAAAERQFAFINVWRPIHVPAIDQPLALCDARTVASDDLVATDIVYPGRRGEIYGVLYNPRHRWFYAPAMQLDEALLLKCADTRANVAPLSPHTSFDNPLAPPGTPPRQSIEFRTIAFFD